MRQHPPAWQIRLESDVRTKSIPTLTPEQEQHFWSRVDVHHPAACWEWTGCIHMSGYGLVGFGRQNLFVAQRVAYTLLMGPIPQGLVTDHLCRNRKCVNPDHIRLVTEEVNKAGRYNRASPYCKNGHLLSPENLYESGLKRGMRQCKECAREASREAYARRRTNTPNLRDGSGYQAIERAVALREGNAA